MSNTAIITGNLTADPELRFTPSGAAVANFTVADTPRRFNKDTQEWEDAGDTLFVRCSIWREDAEHVAEHFARGQKVTVTGRLKQRNWEQDGQKRSVVELDADSVAAHARRAQAQRSSAPQQQQTSQPDPWATGTQQQSTYDAPPF